MNSPNRQSPFFVVEEFISPLQCDRILAACKTDKLSESTTQILDLGKHRILVNSLTDYTDEISQRYASQVNEDFRAVIIQCPELPNKPAIPPTIEAWEISRRKWVKTKNYDLVGFIPLKSYSDDVPIDINFEVYGGKIEMLNYNFSIMPTRGSMIIMPATPNFKYAFSPVDFGTLEFIKIHIRLADGWQYNPAMFNHSVSAMI